MSNVARRWLVLSCIFAVLVGVIVLYFVAVRPTTGTTEAGNGIRGAVPVDSAGPFTIEGNAAEPILPGVMVPLDLKLTNPHEVPLSVGDLTVTVQEVNAPNADGEHPCAVDDFTVSQVSFSSAIILAGRASSTLSNIGLPRATWPQVGMFNRSVNQDGCKGASLTLGYTASGTLKK